MKHKALSGPAVIARLFVLEAFVIAATRKLLSQYPPEQRREFLDNVRTDAAKELKEGTEHAEAIFHGDQYLDELMEEFKQ